MTDIQQPMCQGVIQYVKGKYRRHILERMLLYIEAGKQYEVTLLSAIHTLAFVWKNTPAHMICNSFRRSGFVLSEEPLIIPDDPFAFSAQDDTVFNSVLPSDVLLADYVSLDDSVAVSHQSSELSDGSHCEDAYPCPTLKETAQAMLTLENFFFNSPDSVCAQDHIAALRKLVVGQISLEKGAIMDQK